MSLETKIGDKVVFSFPNNGWSTDKDAANSLLRLNEEYTVESIDIGSYTSYVELKEYPGVYFNTVSFSNVNNKTFEILKNGTKIKVISPGIEGITGEIVGVAYDLSPIFVTYIVKSDRRFYGIDYDCVLMQSSMVEVI